MTMLPQDGTYCKTFANFIDEQCGLIRSKLSVDEDIIKKARTYILESDVATHTKSRLLKEDRWRVAGTTCSVSGRYCQTCDGEPNEHTKQDGGGLLCEHRLAAMIMTKFSHYKPGEESPGGTLKDLLADIFGNARIHPEIVDVRLKYSKEYTFRHGEEQNIIVYGYQINCGDPGSWAYLAPPMAIDTHEFDRMMTSLKWTLDFTFKGFLGQTAHDKETVSAFIPFEEERERSLAYQGAKTGRAKSERDYHNQMTDMMRANPDGISTSSKMKLRY